VAADGQHRDPSHPKARVAFNRFGSPVWTTARLPRATHSATSAGGEPATILVSDESNGELNMKSSTNDSCQTSYGQRLPKDAA